MHCSKWHRYLINSVDKAVEDVTAHRGPKPSRPYITEVRELDGDFFKVSQN